MASSVLFAPCPPALTKLVEPYATKIGLPSLALHIHQVIAAALAYHIIYLLISPALSSFVIPTIYRNFNQRTKINWNVHVVSFLQSTFICILAIWTSYNDPERDEFTKDEAAILKRTFGTSAMQGALQAYAEGYFIWDLFMSARHLSIFGVGFLAHAFSAAMVFSFGFRPFVNYWGPVFVLFELSSPFLNIHWFCDKIGLTGSRTQLINGFFLLTTFFCCRLVWGTYNAALLFIDLFTIYNKPPSMLHPTAGDLLHSNHLDGEPLIVHPFAGKQLPLWLMLIYFASNLTLNLLNFFWFSRMIQTVSARFTKKDKPLKKETLVVQDTPLDITLPKEKEEKLKKRTATRPA